MVLSKVEVEKLQKSVKDLNTRAEAAEQKVADLEKKAANNINQPTAGNSVNSDERKAMAYFGVNNVKSLLDVNVNHPRFTHVPVELKHIVKELKTSVDTARFIAQAFHGAPKDRFGKTDKQDQIAQVKNILETPYGRSELAPRLKAFGSTVSGGGDEWVPTMISSSYIDEYELDKQIEGRMVQIEMPSSPYELPVKSGVTKARKIAENTAITDTNFTTGKLTFTAKKLGEYFILPEELDEDSAVAIMPMAKDELVRAHLRAVESAIINGDDDGTHIDSDTQALGADVAEKLWKGLRRQALANGANGGTLTFSGAAVTKTGLRDMRANGGKFFVDPRQLAWIVGPQVYAQMLALDEVMTVDKMGPLATVLRGALAAYMGIPIIVSEHMREDLNATGVYDGTTTTRGGILLVNEQRWYVGRRRPIKMALSADLPAQDRMLMSAYQRKDFVGHAQSASEVSVVYGYNVLV